MRKSIIINLQRYCTLINGIIKVHCISCIVLCACVCEHVYGVDNTVGKGCGGSDR